MIEKKVFGFVLVLLFAILILPLGFSGYERSNVRYSSTAGSSGPGFFGIPQEQCEMGQDFVVQMTPFGCTPAVVRSDLLEERDVAVYCQLSATKINPLIEVSAIKSMDFVGGWDENIAGVDFMPNRDALRGNVGELNKPFLNDVGYAVIVLKQQPNESAMPDFVEGELKTNLYYDIENAFGLGRQSFYLPEMTDSEWGDEFTKYSFWDSRGYLRAESVGDDSAVVSIYNDLRKLQTFNLDKGEISQSFYMPGFDCLAGVQAKLDGTENPDTRAKLNINGDVVEVKEDQEFLGGACKINNIQKSGLVESVSGSCRTDGGGEGFTLSITPKVKLNICSEGGNCETGEYSVGDLLYTDSSNGKTRNVFLGYLGKRVIDNEYFVVPVISTEASKEEFLSSFDFSMMNYYGNLIATQSTSGISFVDFLESIKLNQLGFLNKLAYSIVFGTDFGNFIEEGKKKDVEFLSQDVLNVVPRAASILSDDWGKPNYLNNSIEFLGFVGEFDKEFGSDADGEKAIIYYEKAIEDFDRVMTSFSETEFEQPGEIDTKGEQTLVAKINLAEYLQQKKSLRQYCAEYKEKYSKSKYYDRLFDDGICNSPEKLSSTSIDKVSYLIRGDLKEISLQGVEEPSAAEYSVEVTIDGEPYVFRNNDEKYLNFASQNTQYSFNFDSNLDEDDVRNAIKNSNLAGFGDDSKCLNYVDEAVEYGKKYGIDPLLLIAIMNQESGCRVNPGEGGAGAVGLMQISSWKNCEGKISGVNSKFDLAGEENIDKNIECGAIILSEGYSDEKKPYDCKEYTFKTGSVAGQTEPSISTTYSGWSRAIRSYNGWGCAKERDDGTEIYADHYFVNEVLEKYANLGGSFSDMKITQRKVAATPDIIVLKDLEKGYAVFDVSQIDHTGINYNYNKGSLKISLGKSQVVGKEGYNIVVNRINLKKVAQVTLKPVIDYSETNTTIPYKIEIEKRGIQLAPDQIQDKIDVLNKTINEWEKKSESLGKVVKGLKAACVGVNAYLTVKNFFANTKGKAIARTQVMRGDGGWYDRCYNKVRNGTYSSVGKCLSDNADEIDSEVDAYYDAIQNYNEKNKELQKKYETTGILGDVFVKDSEYGVALADEVKSNLEDRIREKFDVDSEGRIEIGGDKIEVSKFVNELSYDTTTIEQLRDLELLSSMESESPEFDSMVKKKLESKIKTIYVNTKEINERKAIASASSFDEVNYFESGEKLKKIPYSKDVTFSQVSDDYTGAKIAGGEYVQILVDRTTRTEYLIVLDKRSIVKKTYKVNATVDGKKVLKVYFGAHKEGDDMADNPLGLIFVKYDKGTYENKYVRSIGSTKPEVKFYETEPYAGLPAIVPFDLDDGWYASIKQTLPVGSSISSYDDSGVVNSFYLCNVGEDGTEENRGVGDICQMVNKGTGMPYNQFAGLPESETEQLIDDAFEAISQASRQYGEPSVRIRTSRGNFDIEVGEPAADIPDLQCEDFMSPSDCKILFNVCDPVICPSSRCDLGGKYPVKDVIQTGIVGSVALCLPNFPDVYVPVCLTGIKAGIDGWLSVEKSYKDCLQENLKSGKTVGICDELHSVYKCEFFWRQGIPLAKLAFQKILERSSGQATRGGGEYLGVQSAYQSAEKSVEYFTQYYATSTKADFQANSIESAGSDVCKVAVSAVIPGADSMVNVLASSDSPPQFTGRFDEIPFTTATNPPVSHYKVYYHVYSGKDLGAYYKVYLKGDETSTYYQDTGATRVIANGYIEADSYATDTVDLTAPSGYKELCIMVNDQIECGFQEVSTNFALNYVKEQYVADQAKQKGIRSESECVSGRSSLYSLLNPNIQEGIGDVVSPSIYNYDLIRICATKNPGLSTDSYANMNGSRWVDVGYCDDENMRCWLDTDSVKDAIKNLGIENDVLGEQYDRLANETIASGDYLTNDNEFTAALNGLNETNLKSKPSEILTKIDTITELMDKVFLLNHKGHLFYLRGLEYGKFAKHFFDEFSVGEVGGREGVSNYVSSDETIWNSLDDFNDRQISAYEKWVKLYPGDYVFAKDEDGNMLVLQKKGNIQIAAFDKLGYEFFMGSSSPGQIETTPADVLDDDYVVLEYQDGRPGEDVSYTFVEKGCYEDASNVDSFDSFSRAREKVDCWMWNFHERTLGNFAPFWIPVGVNTQEEFRNFVNSKNLNPSLTASIIGSVPSNAFSDVSDLQGKNYEEGLVSFYNRVLEDDGGPLPCFLGGCPSIVVKDKGIEINTDGLVIFDEQMFDKKWKFSYSKQGDYEGWWWSVGSKSYHFYDMNSESFSYVSDTDVRYYEKLIRPTSLYALRFASIGEGLSILFDFDYDLEFLEVSVPDPLDEIFEEIDWDLNVASVMEFAEVEEKPEVFVIEQKTNWPDIYFVYNKNNPEFNDGWLWTADPNLEDWFSVLTIDEMLAKSQKRQQLQVLLDDISSKTQMIERLQSMDFSKGKDFILGSGGQEFEY